MPSSIIWWARNTSATPEPTSRLQAPHGFGEIAARGGEGCLDARPFFVGVARRGRPQGTATLEDVADERHRAHAEAGRDRGARELHSRASWSTLHQSQYSPGSSERITGWRVDWKCAVACLFFELSQHPT